MLKTEIKRVSKQIKELEEELKEWENYNEKTNEVLRTDINNLKTLKSKYQKSFKRGNFEKHN